VKRKILRMKDNKIIHRLSTINILDLEIHELNFSYCSEDEYFKLVEIQKELILKAYPSKSYFLLNVKNGPTSSRVIEHSKKFVLEYQHYGAHTALYNMNPLARLILKMINIISTSKTNVFDSRELAIDFLLNHYELSKKLATAR
jgi:hypothetical protein